MHFFDKRYLKFLKRFFLFSPKKCVFSLCIAILNTLSSGIGLFLLIPLLELAGWMNHANYLSSHTGPFFLFAAQILQHATLLQLLSLYGALITTVAFLEYVNSWLQNHLASHFLFSLRDHFNYCVASAQWPFLEKMVLKKVEHMQSMGIAQISALSQSSFLFMGDAILLSGYILLSFFISFKITLFSVCCGYFLLYFVKNKSSENFGNANFKLHRDMQVANANFISGLKLSKAQNQIAGYVKEYAQLNKQNISAQISFAKTQRESKLKFRLSATFLFSFTFYAAITWLSLPISALLTLLLVYSRLFSRAGSLQQGWIRIQNTLPSFMEFLQLESNLMAHQESQQALQGKAILPFERILIQNLNFMRGQHFVLSDISLTFFKNTTTVIMGESGAGKSTLIDILLGLQPVSKGKIYIDNTLLNEKNIVAWRNSIAYLPQEPFLFESTIRQNLLWGVSDAIDENELWQALQAAAAKNFVKTLPNQLDTRIGERGIRLSGGERQRLVLARALLRKPQLLIMDEATSALDNENEAIILNTLKRLHRQVTIIIIAHRTSMLSLADQVITLKKEAAQRDTVLN